MRFTMLSAHLEPQGLTSDDTESLVFTDEYGASLRYSNWRQRIWLPAAKAGGCAGAGFHDLRRLNATTLVVGGVDVKTARSSVWSRKRISAEWGRTVGGKRPIVPW
jgi:hypothetical protein